MSQKNKNNRVDVVYSTNPNFKFEYEQADEQETLNPGDQLLYVSIDKKQRGGKEVTLIQGFIGTSDDLNLLGKKLKSKCGVGGTSKDGEIIIQGNFRDKIMTLLESEGYKSKRKGG